MFRRNFLFGADSDTANVIGVQETDLYQPGKGYGFVTEQNRQEQEFLRIPELNSGFDTAYWYQDEEISVIGSDVDGCFLDSDGLIRVLEEKIGEPIQPVKEDGSEDSEGEHRRIPLSFKVDVPRQGNYKVTLNMHFEDAQKNVLIFTGRRRLAFLGDIPAGSFTTTMLVNVCDIVPRGQTRIYTDKTLDITVVADKARFGSMTVVEVNCPTIYIAGDSTVTDQSADYPYAPGTSYSGWGQMLTAYLDDRIAVSNHSHSGLTTDSFRKEGHYAVIEQYSKPRDFFFFQFGHNDQKLAELKAPGGYKANLMRYISECRQKGAYPVLVTPIARNTWKGNDGTYNDLLEEYAKVCLEIGRIAEVPVLDLHARSMEFVISKGLEAAKAYFFPKDYTHSNDYGAYIMAGFVAQEIVRTCSNFSDPGYHFLAKCVTEGFGEWKAPGRIELPVKPKIYDSIMSPAAGPDPLADVEEPEKPASRVDVLDMIIRTVRFFPTNVYNDMYEDVVGHEWYAGTVECAYQNGMIDEHLVEGTHFRPEKEVTLEEFLVFAMNGYQSRKHFPKEEACIYDTSCHDYARPYVRAAVGIGLLPSDARMELDQIITRGEAVALCRKMGI